MEPPEMIEAGELVLQRWDPAWAPEAAAAVRESLAELSPFLPWASENYDLAAAQEYLARSDTGWAQGTEFNYAIRTAAGELAGAIGLMTRQGPGTLEIGYWMRTAYAGRGYMTAAVQALTAVALALPGIERVVIHHDAANEASGAVAAKAGFAEVDRVRREPQAPRETYVSVIRERRG